MKRSISLLFLTIFCCASVLSLAQDKLKSSKILYDTGLEEIYDVQAYNGGYIALGHKGDAATTKKLWLLKFDKDLNVLGSKVIYNQELVSPFRLQKLGNGNVLVLAQDISQKVQSSILFCLHPEGAISWSKRFASKVNIELSDLLITKDQSIYLYGAKKHILNQFPNTDKALLVKMDQQGNQKWQKEIDMGDVELRTKQLKLGDDNKLLLTGTLVDVSDILARKSAVTAATKVKEGSGSVMGRVIADTMYIEDPITGQLEMRIISKGSIAKEKKKEADNSTISIQSDKPVKALFTPRLKLKADTIYTEDPVTGQLEMRIVTKKVEKKKYSLEVKDRVSALGQYYPDIIKKEESKKVIARFTKNGSKSITFDGPSGRLVMKGGAQKKIEKKNGLTNGIINFYALQLSLDGDILHQTAINEYADYSFSNAVVENEQGYLFLLQSANYFGDGLLLQTDKNLNTIQTKTLTGSPMLFSGLFKQNNDYIVGGVFSNTLKDYSPGFVLLNNELDVLQSKSSKSLFSHFFISNIAPMQGNSFMLSGIGYENDQPSDIYFLPFSAEGKSACELTSYDMTMKRVANVIPFTLEAQVKNKNILQVSDAQFALADDNKFTSGSVCTTPDEYPVDNKENGSWNQWNKKNGDAFSMKIPKEWIQVSPNPSEGEFTVQYDGMQNEIGLRIRVTDMNGRMVYNDFLQNQDVFKLDLRKLSPGIYHLQIHDGFKSQMKKITVAK